MNKTVFFHLGFQTLIKREILRFFRLYKQTLIPSIISSGLYIIIFGHSLGQKIGTIQGVSYMHFIIPGLIMMNVITPAYQNSASSIMQAKFLKFMDDLLITPLSGYEISFSYIIGGTMRGFLNGLLVFALAYTLTGFVIKNVLLTLFFLIIVSWTFASIGVVVGLLSKTWDSMMIYTNFIFTPLIFLGGVFYSLDMIPPFWKNISLLNPIYWMINGLRFSTLEISEISNNFSIVVCIFFATFFTFIAGFLFNKGYGIKS